MSKKNKAAINVENTEVNPAVDAQQANSVQAQEKVKGNISPDLDRFISNDKLQAYYNDAYINERDRLNAMFGRIDTYPVVEEKIVYRDPDLSSYVPMDKYKKKCRCATVMGVLFGIALVAAAALAVVHFLL